MKKIFFISAVLFVCNYSFIQAQNNQSLHINSQYVTDLMSSKGTNFNAVLIAADTVFIDEDVNITGLSIVVICNKFIGNNKKLTILPTNNIGNGSFLKIISKTTVDGNFNLPGVKGENGRNGRSGSDGSPNFLGPNDEESNVGVIDTKNGKVIKHNGEVGEDGHNGNDGSNGGNLLISSFSANNHITFLANGGEGGEGGNGGSGGKSYVREIAKTFKVKGENGEMVIKTIYKPTPKAIQENSGKPGLKGRQGVEGQKTQQIIDENTFKQEIQKYGIESWNNSIVLPFTDFLVSSNPNEVNFKVRRRVFPHQISKKANN